MTVKLLAQSDERQMNPLKSSQQCFSRGTMRRPFGIVRHVTHDSIPGSTRRNEEKCSWVIQSTLSRKARGKVAYWKSHRVLTDEREQGWRGPRGMSKARLPEVQLTVVENGAYGKASEAHTNLCRGYQSRPLQPPEVRTVASEVT